MVPAQASIFMMQLMGKQLQNWKWSPPDKTPVVLISMSKGIVSFDNHANKTHKYHQSDSEKNLFVKFSSKVIMKKCDILEISVQKYQRWFCNPLTFAEIWWRSATRRVNSKYGEYRAKSCHKLGNTDYPSRHTKKTSRILRFSIYGKFVID